MQSADTLITLSFGTEVTLLTIAIDFYLKSNKKCNNFKFRSYYFYLDPQNFMRKIENI